MFGHGVQTVLLKNDFLRGFKQSHGVSEPAALPRHQRQSDGEPGECWSDPVNAWAAFHPLLLSSLFTIQTGIWTELYRIEDTFLKPLRVGVNMSRAHYERELHNTVEARRSKAKGPTTDCTSALGQVYFFKGWKTKKNPLCHVFMSVSCMFPQRSLCSLCLLETRSCRP